MSSIFKKSFQELFKKFVKSKGRFPTPAERDKLRDMALKIEPPGKGQISVTIDGETKNMSPEGIMNFLMRKSKPPKKEPFNKLIDPESDTGIKLGKVREGLKKRETEAEMLERMKRQNKESVERLKKKKEKDLGDKLKDLPDDIDPDAMADGGIARVGMNKGGKLLKFLSENSPFQAYRKYLQSVKRRAQTEPKKLFPELAAVASGGIFVNRRMKDILEKGNLEQKERFLNEYIEEINDDPFYKDRPELKDKAIEKYTENLFGEKKAMGGRTGYFKGGKALLEFLQSKLGKKAITTADKIDRPARAKLADEFKAFNIRNRKLTEDELDELYEEFGEAVPYPMETVADRNRFLKSVQDEKDYMFQQYKAGKLDPKPGERGRKKFLQKKMEEMEMSGDKKLMTQDEIKELADYDQKIKPKKTLESLEKTGSIDISDPAIVKEFEEFMKRTDPEGYEKLKAFEESIGRTKQAKGGIARIGFDKGGMTRRTFLKLLGGLASIPVVGKLFKPAAKVSKAVEAASKSAEVPSYFPKLVYKIQLLGDDITKTAATKERQIVKNYKGYELTEDLDSGSLVIKKDGYTKEEYLQYSPSGQYYDETRKKVIKYPEQYEEVTVKPDFEGKMKDVDSGLDSADDIIEEVETTDFEFLKKQKQKKASGGLAYMMGE